MPARGGRSHRPTAPRAPRRPTWADQVPGPSDPLPDQVQQFLDHLHIQRNRPMTTVRAYRQDLAKFVAFSRTRKLDDNVLSSVDRTTLRRYQIELAEVMPNARSRARALVGLRQFLQYGYDEGWISDDLSRQVVVPRYVVGDPHPIATHTVPQLLAALPRATLRDLRDRALVHFLIASGCRIAEACALNRNDIGRDGFRVLGKGGKHRTVFLTDDAHAAVQDYLGSRGPDAAPALFISVAHADMPKGHPLPHNRLTTDGARTALTALRRRMSCDPASHRLIDALRSPHAARHTAATTLLEATDGDVRLVQEVLGHATLETLRVYTEITDKRKRSAYRRLGDYMREVSSST
ncbi:MAG: tyrosine-type recombinase/integrase [Candidatus Dormibacteria bacterium]